MPQPRHELLRYAQLACGGEGFAEYVRQLAMLGFQAFNYGADGASGLLTDHLRSPSDDRGGGRVAADLQVLRRWRARSAATPDLLLLGVSRR